MAGRGRIHCAGRQCCGSTVADDVKVSNTETVQVLMDAAGKIENQRVYEQLVLTGRGAVDVANPVSTQGCGTSRLRRLRRQRRRGSRQVGRFGNREDPLGLGLHRRSFR